jgi:hypothetical protein
MITITQVAAGDEEEVSSPTIATRAYVEWVRLFKWGPSRSL